MNRCIKKILLLAIRSYQFIIKLFYPVVKVFFPSGLCRFSPSCSEYAYLAIEKYGIKQGIKKSIKRLLKCHPFKPGGIDYP